MHRKVHGRICKFLPVVMGLSEWDFVTFLCSFSYLSVFFCNEHECLFVKKTKKTNKRNLTLQLTLKNPHCYVSFLISNIMPSLTVRSALPLPKKKEKRKAN